MPVPAGVNPDLDLRRVRFGRFVARVFNAAQERGMSVPEIEAAAKVGKSTVYSWIKGEWDRDPVPAKVYGFCDGLGADRSEADQALGWESGRSRREPEPTLDPLVRDLGRALQDPKVSPDVKLFLRRQLRIALAGLEDHER